MRGEQTKEFENRVMREGSPPLARGTEVKVCSDSAYVGITPACAGNSVLQLII